MVRPQTIWSASWKKHNLKSGFSIYFADVHFEKQVYAFGSGLGFTSVIYAYSLGRDPEEAEKLALEKYDSDETKVKKVHVNLARSRGHQPLHLP